MLKSLCDVVRVSGHAHCNYFVKKIGLKMVHYEVYFNLLTGI